VNGNDENFLELYGDILLKDIVSDWPLEALTDAERGWFHLPPPEFVAWAREFPRYPGLEIIGPSSQFKKTPSLLLTQTHKYWMDGERISKLLPQNGTLIDFGAYPFFDLLALRSYYRHQATLVGTAIQDLNSEMLGVLRQYEIDVGLLDLDPYVVDPTKPKLPTKFDRPDASADIVTMMHVFEHLYHPMNSLRESYRLLKSGGRLIIATDNAMALNTFLNYISGYGYVMEDVAETCAMKFHEWRGHVRLYTSQELGKMVQAVGFDVEEFGFEEVFYDVIHGDYFYEAQPRLSRWRKAILGKHRQFCNDVYLIAIKR
jgi:ubiquinone/menaquinone biosynthesis C-methylase UbiE